MVRSTALLLALLLIPLGGAQVDANERTENAPLTIPSTVTHVSVAGDGSGFLLGRADPCGNPTTESPCTGQGADGPASDQDVWYFFNDEGLLDRFDDADPRSAGACQPILASDCRFHVVAADISADGERMIIASRSSDNDEGVILLMTPFQGVVQRIQLTGSTNGAAVNDVDLSDDGQFFAVATTIPVGLDDDTGRVYGFTWTGVGEEAWRADTAAPATVVAVAEDGGRIAAGAGAAVRYTAGGSVHTVDQIDGTVTAVDIAPGSQSYSVAGYSTNWVALFGASGDSGSSSQQLASNKMLGSVTAVAIAPDGSLYVGGDADGRLRLYANREILVSSKSVLAATSSLGAPVHDLEWAADGEYLVAAIGNQLFFYAPDTGGFNQGWSVDLGAPVLDVDISDNGDVVVAAVEDRVHVFDALRTVAVVAPERRSVEPGGTTTIEATFENTGNRRFDVESDLRAKDWEITADDADFTLDPGEKHTVEFTVAVPEGHAVEEVVGKLQHRINGGSLVERDVTFDVDQVQSWVLTPTPPLNQAIEPGQTVTFRATAKNLGNAEDETDIFADLDQSMWQMDVQPTKTTRAPGEEQEILVTLTAPDDAAELEEAIVRLTLSADADAELILSATVGAAFGVDFVSALPVTVEQGNTSATVLTIRNAGNALDSYRLTVGALPTGWGASFTGGQTEFLAPTVLPGTERQVGADIMVPADAMVGTYQVSIQVASLSDNQAQATRAVQVTVIEPLEPEENGGGPDDNESPGFSLVFLLVALAVAVARRTMWNRQD